MLAGWAAAALLAAGPAPAPARCLNRIPVRVRRSAAGRAGQRSGRRPASAVSAGPSGASRVGVAGMEEEFRLGKDSFGLDESQVRLYTAIAPHTVLVMACRVALPALHGTPC